MGAAERQTNPWDIIKGCITPNTKYFDITKFFNEWFYQNGYAYTIIFKKNLATTDMQYAELYPLIRQFTTKTVGNNPTQPPLMFHNSHEFKEAVSNVVNAILETIKGDSFDWNHLSGTYNAILENSIVLDARFGSCSVLVPPTLAIALAQICAQSGYIDSCGIQIYARAIDKATGEKLVERLVNYLDRRNNDPLKKGGAHKIHFASWAHELSYPSEHRDGVDIANDLSALKFHQDKVKLNKIKIADIVRNSIVSNPKLQQELHFSDENVEISANVSGADGTIWLLQDRSIEYRPQIHAGRRRFLLCYHQLFKNCNPLHIFDENKPAWVGPVTMPHSLLGAMINITRPWPQRTGAEIKIHDPFCGTGSLLLEMLKDSSVSASGSDLAIETELLLKDNIEFLALAAPILRTIATSLREAANALSSVKGVEELTNEAVINGAFRGVAKDTKTELKKAILLLEEAKKCCDDNGDAPSYSFKPEFINELEKIPISIKVFFYVFLRAQLAKTRAANRRQYIWGEGFKLAAMELAKQIESYSIWKEGDLAETSYPRLPSELAKFSAPFSMRISVSPNTLQTKNIPVFHKMAIKASASNDAFYDDKSFHVIVTDPPYGFNTEEDILDLAKLYGSFLQVWIRKLAPRGHLVICLPEETYNGQTLPFCTSSNLIIAQVLAAAADSGKKVISNSNIHPAFAPGLRAPHYWQSDKVLRRTILHFQFDLLN